MFNLNIVYRISGGQKESSVPENSIEEVFHWSPANGLVLFGEMLISIPLFLFISPSRSVSVLQTLTTTQMATRGTERRTASLRTAQRRCPI